MYHEGPRLTQMLTLVCLNQTAEASGQDLIAKRLAQEKTLKRQILEDQKGRHKQEPEEEAAEMDLPIILIEEEEELVVSLALVLSNVLYSNHFLLPNCFPLLFPQKHHEKESPPEESETMTTTYSPPLDEPMEEGQEQKED